MQRVGLSHLCILEYSQCDTKVEKDDQQTETMMVPATLTHFVTIAANLTKRKRPEEQLSTTQGKEGEHAQNIWKEGNFQLFLFEILPLKHWPCRSANLILELRSVFMRTRLVQYVHLLKPSSSIPIKDQNAIRRQINITFIISNRRC